MRFDAVIVGGGTAGLSAAVWLGRYRRSTLLLDAGQARNGAADAMHGVLGFDGHAPGELLGRARAELGRYRTVEIRPHQAHGARATADGFQVVTDAGTIECRRVVLATGVADVFPEVGRFFEHYGSGAFHCPSCDGFEEQGRRVVVFGWSQQVAGFALDLLDWAASVVVVTDGNSFEGDAEHRGALARHRIRVVEQEAAELLGPRGGLHGVRLGDGSDLPCDLVFFSIAHHPRTDLAVQLGCQLDDEGYVGVDNCGRTSVAGVFAAGDVTPGFQLVQAAAGEGATAGVACAYSLKGEARADQTADEAEASAPEPGPDPEAELTG